MANNILKTSAKIKVSIKKKNIEDKKQLIVNNDNDNNNNNDNNDNDNYVITQYKSAICVSEFLLRNAYCALNSQRVNIIFEPYPTSWKINDNLNNNLNDNLDTHLDIPTYCKSKNINTNIENVLSIIQSSYNDNELIENININTYKLIRFILESNNMMIKADNLLNSSDVISITHNTHNTPNTPITPNGQGDKDISLNLSLNLSSILQFKLIHTQLIEDKFKDKNTIYLYHGSLYPNWYSIMRNGIKIGSKTKYFLNGAAYGNGIYLSNDINMSLGYSQVAGIGAGVGAGVGAGAPTQMILAIFEVIDNPKWRKTGTIFVVDDENALILRYLLVFAKADIHNPYCQAICKAINIKLNNGGIKALETQKKEMENKNIITIHNKRLMKEYQNIMKQSTVALGFHIQLCEEDNLSKWMIYITNPENMVLSEQMCRLGIKAIEIEITFKDNYPIAPPFIRVVYPHFKFHSGHITVGGSLCMEMLTNQGWSPTFNVENVITQIKLAISEGGGEIDEVNYKKRYTMDEAIDAFTRVLATHGWV